MDETDEWKNKNARNTYFIDELRKIRNTVLNANTVLIAARRKWVENLMEPEEVEDLFVETLTQIEYALFPYLDPEDNHAGRIDDHATRR